MTMRLTVHCTSLITGILALILPKALAGTVYGCYNVPGAAQYPPYVSELTGAVVLWATNCDSTCYASSSGVSVSYQGLSAKLFNSADNGIADPATVVAGTFDVLTWQSCPNGIGYWYYDGSDHNTGIVDYQGFPDARRDTTKLTVSDAPITISGTGIDLLSSLHNYFGGLPNASYYVPHGVEDFSYSSVSDFKVSIEHVFEAVKASQSRKAREVGHPHSDPRLDSSHASRLSPRNGDTCTAITSPLDRYRGFGTYRYDVRVWFQIAGVAAVTASSWADHIMGQIQNGISTTSMVTDWVVRNNAYTEVTLQTLESLTWNSAVSSITATGLNLLIYDAILDYGSNAYTQALYAIASDSGEVLVELLFKSQPWSVPDTQAGDY